MPIPVSLALAPTLLDEALGPGGPSDAIDDDLAGTLRFVVEFLHPPLASGPTIRPEAARHGDVLAVCRGVYWHFGILATDGPEPTVIHYTSEGSDTSVDNRVMETALPIFLRWADGCHVVHVNPPGQADAPGALTALLGEAPRLHAPDETVRRARQRLGERSYNLISNNCEHFVLWCKTGVSRSRQVEHVLELICRTASALAREA